MKEKYCIGLQQLKKYMTKMGVYIISGLSEEVQTEMQSLLGANTCINMLEEHMEGSLYEHIIDIAIEGDGDVILFNTKSKELIEAYIDTFEELAKFWKMRIHIYYQDDIGKLKNLQEYVEAIALFNIVSDENEIDVDLEDKFININC